MTDWNPNQAMKEKLNGDVACASASFMPCTNLCMYVYLTPRHRMFGK